MLLGIAAGNGTGFLQHGVRRLCLSGFPPAINPESNRQSGPSDMS
jgi:hypothetical protein